MVLDVSIEILEEGFTDLSLGEEALFLEVAIFLF